MKRNVGLAALLLTAFALIGRPLAAQAPRAYLGFDSNEYPGDSAWAELHMTFAFTGYWLNTPPGADTNPWAVHRAAIVAQGFGFLVLYNGRLEAELKRVGDAGALGDEDAARAASA